MESGKWVFLQRKSEDPSARRLPGVARREYAHDVQRQAVGATRHSRSRFLRNVACRLGASSPYRSAARCSAPSSFATWLQAHPSVELISRDRGTTEASGANRGAPQALQIADRGPLLRNLGEALEKVLIRHHADLKRVFTPREDDDQLIVALDQQALMRLKALSQAEQLRQARRAQHEAVAHARSGTVCTRVEWCFNRSYAWHSSARRL